MRANSGIDRSASECRRFHVQGWGRWHDAEAGCDSKSLQSLSKLVGDIPTIRHLPNTDHGIIANAQNYKFADAQSPDEFIKHFPHHLKDWTSREKKLITCLTATAKMANDYDTALYKVSFVLKKKSRMKYSELKICSVECG